jgi:excisionase family DNA binding protein
MEKRDDRTDLEMMSPMAVARSLGLGRTTIYRMLSSGELPGVRIGSSWRIPVAVLRRYLAERSMMAVLGDAEVGRSQEGIK